MKTFNYFLIALFVLTFNKSFSFVNRKDSIREKSKADSLICLEINGRISILDDPKATTYTAELIEGNTVIDVITKKDNKSFTFFLEKNRYYAIRIVKAGYAPKLISINTNIANKFTDELYSFRFETELFTEEEFTVLDKDAQDFPIAVVVFDEQKKAFDYNDKYTGNIKKCLIKGIAFE